MRSHDLDDWREDLEGAGTETPEDLEDLEASCDEDPPEIRHPRRCSDPHCPCGDGWKMGRP